MSWRESLAQWLTGKPVTKYRVVEVKLPKTLTRWDKETEAAVSTLQSHPGFLALVERLETQRALLESVNNTRQKKTAEEANAFVHGIYWCGWLQEQVAKATFKGSQRHRNAYDEELLAFKEIDSQIERVGMDSETTSL